MKAGSDPGSQPDIKMHIQSNPALNGFEKIKFGAILPLTLITINPQAKRQHM